MTILQLTVRGTCPGAGEALNIWHFDGGTLIETATAALQSVYAEFAPVLSDDATFDLDPVVRELDESDGSLVALGSGSWPAPVDGAGVGMRGADATALLVAWNTATVHSGRVIRGRTFFPFPSLSVCGEGQVSGGGIAAVDAALADALVHLVTADAVIWSRPGPGGPGAMGSITSGAVRREYSYQGRRRS